MIYGLSDGVLSRIRQEAAESDREKNLVIGTDLNKWQMHLFTLFDTSQ